MRGGFGCEARASRRFGRPRLVHSLLNRDWFRNDSALIWSLILTFILSPFLGQKLSLVWSLVLSPVLSPVSSLIPSRGLNPFLSQILGRILSLILSLIFEVGRALSILLRPENGVRPGPHAQNGVGPG